MLRHQVIGLATLMIVAATAQPGTAQPGPTLILEDSVVLRETGDHYVGQPVSLIPAGDGSFLVADGFSNSVLHFDSRGGFQRRLGRKGHGPGEFRFVSSAGFAAGDLVGVGDDHALELELFELRSGRHIGAVKMSPSALLDDYVVRGDHLWFAGVNKENWTSVGFVRLDDLFALASSGGGDGSALSPSLVGVPDIYPDNEAVMGMLAEVSLDVWEGRTVIGFAASPHVRFANVSGAEMSTVGIPVARRRGLPPAEELLALGSGPGPAVRPARTERPSLSEFLARESGTGVTDIFGTVSFLLKVSRDSEGFVHTVHQESEYDAEARQMRGTFFVSSVKEDGTRPCPDTFVPTSDAGLPELALEGNRLHVLDQRLAGSGIRTVIRTFRIDPVNCTGEIETNERG